MTIRQIPETVENKIKDLASKSGLSINKTVLMLLTKSLGMTESGKVKRDISKLAGTWSKKDQADFDKSMEVFDKIDQDIWESP